MTSEKVVRGKPIPDYKKKLVEELSEKMTHSKTVLIASCKGLPGQQYHDIKKKLRGKAEVKSARKTAVIRAIDNIEKGAIKNLKEQVTADTVVLFSDIDPFALSGILTDNQSDKLAKPGDISPEDIEIEPGPTDLVPGPAISELGSVGLKVAVKDGKLEILKGAMVVKAGEEIKANVASVLGKLDIAPMKVGFIPVAAYSAEDDAVYVDIVIDKEGTLETMRDMIGKALGFSVSVTYPVKENISYLLAKANSEEKALEKLVGVEAPAEEEKKDDTPTEETPAVENTEENTQTETTKEDTK